MPLVSKKFVYYPCPRTGSTSVRRMLELAEIDFLISNPFHATPDECPTNLPKLATVRDPAAWLESWRGLVATEPEWSWQVQPWLLAAKTNFDAISVMRRFSAGCFIANVESLADDLQRFLDMIGADAAGPITEVHANKRNY